MKKILSVLVAGSTALLCWSFITKETASSANSSIEPDSVFILDASSSSMMEIQLGTIAQQKAQDPRVKNYGAMMVKDHTAATAELVPIAGRLGVNIPATLLPKHAKHVSHLENMTGAAFDRAYINMMVEAHKDDIDEFEDASKKAADTELRAWAAKQLPVLQMHRDSAVAIRKR
ncbi:MAG TPA: DUF4142 domain-containing protein [Flavisolibacter sp.]|nr:DUF4142 domain-containing protein [Flavisolibacter sp.]